MEAEFDFSAPDAAGSCHTALVVSAHAPHEGADLPDKQTFWECLTNVLVSARVRAPLVPRTLLIDANARLGSFPDT